MEKPRQRNFVHRIRQQTWLLFELVRSSFFERKDNPCDSCWHIAFTWSLTVAVLTAAASLSMMDAGEISGMGLTVNRTPSTIIKLLPRSGSRKYYHRSAYIPGVFVCGNDEAFDSRESYANSKLCDLVRSAFEGKSLSRRESCLLNGDAWLRCDRPRNEFCRCNNETLACGLSMACVLILGVVLTGIFSAAGREEKIPINAFIRSLVFKTYGAKVDFCRIRKWKI